jgi:cyanophycin synthetase
MADLAQRLDVTGRRIVVLAGPGDRRDEDLVAIARAVAGRFDHYICRRDDHLRERAPDEVPRIQSQALRAAGVSAAAISIIPDEQEAIDAALRMGEAGDLLLIFADALVRSWKQITKFKPAGVVPTPAVAPAPASDLTFAGTPPPVRARAGALDAASGASAEAAAAEAELSLDGLIRDERGVRLAPESDD